MVKELRKVGRSYMYAMVVFSLLVLAYSIWIIASSIQGKMEGKTEGFYFGLAAGVIGIGLALSSFLRLRGRIRLISQSEGRMLTTVECPKCNVKMKRKFQTGDYVNRITSKCSKCGGEQTITSIYMEKPEKP